MPIGWHGKEDLLRGAAVSPTYVALAVQVRVLQLSQIGQDSSPRSSPLSCGTHTLTSFG